jgi:hypothetical protein
MRQVVVWTIRVPSDRRPAFLNEVCAMLALPRCRHSRSNNRPPREPAPSTKRAGMIRLWGLPSRAPAAFIAASAPLVRSDNPMNSHQLEQLRPKSAANRRHWPDRAWGVRLRSIRGLAGILGACSTKCMSRHFALGMRPNHHLEDIGVRSRRSFRRGIVGSRTRVYRSEKL